MAVAREDVIAYLGRLGPAELQELILELEDLWGMEPVYAGPVHVTMGAPLYDPNERMGIPEFDVVLLSPGPRRVQVMKTIREAVPLGLAEVMVLVDQTPSVVARGLVQYEAQALRVALEALGAKVEIR
ncbi:large subunit ribosomal protein L7/L12 [Nannocystis exedens]|uniref:Large subunit ribosomal protein L7/L12 n=1 Tax=Nannocystis exedens TaxID=54 RepID=A0A1I2FLH4_9BACT|nr:ribosomal protein L7/L12 [Nannocystis exedens]PCC74458.1 50S ribosomal protein L7/L12 [Nannocystis exedens]SFF06135.1 large subunit ribosomal protein L7/L12 [Nannocystis exedens]